MDRENADAFNPYTEMEGYRVFDRSGERVGRVEDTIYDAESDVLKYVIVDGKPIPAEEISVNAEQSRVMIPFDAETVETAPKLQRVSGAFDDAVREHYGTDT